MSKSEYGGGRGADYERRGVGVIRNDAAQGRKKDVTGALADRIETRSTNVINDNRYGRARHDPFERSAPVLHGSRDVLLSSSSSFTRFGTFSGDEPYGVKSAAKSSISNGAEIKSKMGAASTDEPAKKTPSAIMLLGASKVGKTNMVHALVKKRVQEEQDATLQDSHGVTVISDGNLIPVRLIDCGGAVSQRENWEKDIPKSHGFFLLYACNDPFSFVEVQRLYNKIRKEIAMRAPIAICLTKFDIIQHEVWIENAENVVRDWMEEDESLWLFKVTSRQDMGAIEALEWMIAAINKVSSSPATGSAASKSAKKKPKRLAGAATAASKKQNAGRRNMVENGTHRKDLEEEEDHPHHRRPRRENGAAHKSGAKSRCLIQ